MGDFVVVTDHSEVMCNTRNINRQLLQCVPLNT